MKKVVLLTALLASVASAGIVTNTFDTPAGPITLAPSPFGPNALGVTFEFSGGTAKYGDSIGTGVLGLSPLSDPVLAGDASGVLTLTFDQPSTILSFDFVLGLMTAESQGVSVALSGPDFSGSNPFFGSSTPQGLFQLSIGSFNYSGSPFTQAVITFASDAVTAKTTFAIDNLTFDPPTDPTPEPGPSVLVFSGLLLIASKWARNAGLAR